jgi:hypothetical protein
MITVAGGEAVKVVGDGDREDHERTDEGARRERLLPDLQEHEQDERGVEDIAES